MQLSPINAVTSCQPLKQTVSSVPLREVAFKNAMPAPETQTPPTEQGDKFIKEKYDLACRVAAYYKNQYDSLSSKGSCVV